MIEKPYPTLGPERFAALQAKVKKAKADREKAGYYPPFTDKDMKFTPFDLEGLREEIRLEKLKKAAK